MFRSDLMNEANVHEVHEASSAPSTTTTDWIRVKEALARFPLGRGKLYRLIGSGAIRSASLCQPGQTRATRLICRSSLAAFIESSAKGGVA